MTAIASANVIPILPPGATRTSDAPTQRRGTGAGIATGVGTIAAGALAGGTALMLTGNGGYLPIGLAGGAFVGALAGIGAGIAVGRSSTDDSRSAAGAKGGAMTGALLLAAHSLRPGSGPGSVGGRLASIAGHLIAGAGIGAGIGALGAQASRISFTGA